VLDYELGDVTVWVSLNNRKPFPINFYRKNGDWCYDVICSKLDDADRIEIDGFARNHIHQMYETWKPYMKTRLRWDASRIGRKGQTK
jgi:hypothetical protein